MFALCDGNNFYCSCERVINWKLKGVPVVVLSNNDGNVVSRSDEAKALGIPMGAAWHLLDPAISKQLHPFSSNYELYGSLSARVVTILRMYTPQVEIYSIDESFMGLDGFPVDELVPMCRRARQQIADWVHIPTCIGIGPTKTLAKVANRYAKKNKETGGVFALITADEQERVLAGMDLEDVWGVGRRYAERMKQLGMRTALDLRNADPSLIKKLFTVVMERTCRELKGESCLELEDVPPEKKSLMASRSFGSLVTQLPDMQQAITLHAARAGEKLRQQGLVANRLTVHIYTNKFRKDDPQYYGAQAVDFSAPTADSLKLARYATWALRRAWKDGYKYLKCGVLCEHLHPAQGGQISLLTQTDSLESQRLMEALDKLNRVHGRETVQLAGCGGRDPSWKTRANYLSRRATTRWEEIMTVKAW